MADTNEMLESGLAKLIEQVSSLILSPQYVSRRLGELSVNTFADRARLTVSFNGEEFSWGVEADAAGDMEALAEVLDESVSVKLQCAAWPKSAQEQACLGAFTKLARVLWGTELRGKGGIELPRQLVHAQMAKSVSWLASQADASQVIVLFADLDHFGALNKQAGQDTGDKAIRFVNAKFHELCRTHGGLPFHQSGDEFCLVLPDIGLLATLKGLRKLRRDIRSRTFTGPDGRGHHVDLTIGMCWIPAESSFEQIDAARSTAEETAKRSGESGEFSKRRGKVCFPSRARAGAKACHAVDLASLGVVLVRRRLLREAFGDPRLNLIATVVEDAADGFGEALFDVPALKSEVDEVIDWLDIEVGAECTTSSVLDVNPPRAMGRVAIALAVTQGLLRSARAAATHGHINLTVARDGRSVALSDGSRVLWGDEGINGVTILVGGGVVAPQSHRCFIGVQYGLGAGLTVDDESPLPSDLFEKLILVDERPKNGGGLPDFWQVAVAEVCRASALMAAEPYVLVWGKDAEYSETFRRLKSGSEWSIDEVVSLTGIPSEAVRGLKETLAKNTALHTDSQTVIASLLNLAEGVSRAECLEPDDRQGGAALPRNLLARQPLSATDGLRCNTALEAYPLVLDVLRKGTKRQSVDDANQRLSELISFRLVLEAPSQSIVPTYFQQQESDMDRYAQEVLLSPRGQISSLLWTSGQIDVVVKHLASYFTDPASTNCTRRACLVVPNDVADGQLRPLGLISVWATPRAAPAERDLVDFVFVWRTVEAFVGFPFSLYGSIRLAQKLLELVAEQLASNPHRPNLRVGNLIYVALSLHMRIDGVHQRIAKRIVDAASD